MAENLEITAEVVKKALFGDSREQQISENILNQFKNTSKKEAANNLLLGSGSVVKKRLENWYKSNNL